MKRKVFSILFALVLVLSLGLVMAVPVAAATPIYVNAATGDDANDGQTPENAVKTISKGIELVDPGGTVCVAAGTYDEHIVINKDNLTLLGAQHDVDPRPSFGGRSGPESIIRPYVVVPPFFGKETVLIEANNVLLNGFTIMPDFADDSSQSGDFDIVKQNNEHSGTVVKYNIITFTGRYYAGDDLIQLKKCTEGVIEYNYGHDIKGNAFNFAYSTNCSIQYNEAHHCGMVDHPEWGGAIYTYNSTNIDVIGNKIYDSLGMTFGSTVKWPDLRNTGGTVKNNTVDNATFNGLEIYADGVLVEGNEIYNCNGNAIKIIGTNVTVQGNNLYDNNMGILVEDNSPIISAGISIHYNNIEGNAGYGVKNEAAGILDATSNWWGDASGPYHATSNPYGSGDAVSDNVDFIPWLNAPFQVSQLYELLDELKVEISGLDKEAFSNSKAWAGQQKALLNKVDAVFKQVEAGAYRGAINKLQNDVKDKIEKWIVDVEQPDLIAKVNAAITVLEDLLE